MCQRYNRHPYIGNVLLVLNAKDGRTPATPSSQLRLTKHPSPKMLRNPAMAVTWVPTIHCASSCSSFLL
eukprot:9873229-Prorocentrum_lima.AAC.1